MYQLDETLNLTTATPGFVWISILVVDLVWGLNPTFETLFGTIWIIFIAGVLLKLLLTPKKGAFQKSNWLTVIALVVPTFWVFQG